MKNKYARAYEDSFGGWNIILGSKTAYESLEPMGSLDKVKLVCDKLKYVLQAVNYYYPVEFKVGDKIKSYSEFEYGDGSLESPNNIHTVNSNNVDVCNMLSAYYQRIQ